MLRSGAGATLDFRMLFPVFRQEEVEISCPLPGRLGRSLRVPDPWEQIKMFDGLSLTVSATFHTDYSIVYCTNFRHVRISQAVVASYSVIIKSALL